MKKKLNPSRKIYINRITGFQVGFVVSNVLASVMPVSVSDVQLPHRHEIGKDLTVEIAKKKLSVGLKNQEPILTGDLCKEVKVEDSTWTIGEYHQLF